MGDPLSIAAGVAGLVSLGIQTVQGLVDFYSSYKSQNTTIARTTDKLGGLLGTLQTINQTLTNRLVTARRRNRGSRVCQVSRQAKYLTVIYRQADKWVPYLLLRSLYRNFNRARAARASLSARLFFPFSCSGGLLQPL